MKHYYLGVLAALTMTSSVFACGSDADYVGSICTTAAAYCPANTLEANGQILQVTQNQALFSLLYNTYGGDGKTTFALPDLRGRAPVGVSYNVPSAANQPVSMGTKRGSESVALTTAQMPIHIHNAAFTPSNGTNPIAVTVPVSSNTSGNTTVPSPTNNYLAASPSGDNGGNMWSSTPSTPPVTLAGVTTTGGTGTGNVTVATTGASVPVSTISPELGLKYCVVTVGYYPPRPD
ncbi:MAG: tail fiber protein [Campylobacterales bacterium]|nr:tail fiber protein [Campylobacterales bacterium]